MSTISGVHCNSSNRLAGVWRPLPMFVQTATHLLATPAVSCYENGDGRLGRLCRFIFQRFFCFFLVYCSTQRAASSSASSGFPFVRKMGWAIFIDVISTDLLTQLIHYTLRLARTCHVYSSYTDIVTRKCLRRFFLRSQCVWCWGLVAGSR